MTEAIIITAIIVGGVVALAWIVLHFSFKAWRQQRQAAGDGSVQVQVAGDFANDLATWPLSEQQAERLRYFTN